MLGGDLTTSTPRRRLQWSAQPTRYRRRLHQTRRLYEYRRLKQVAVIAVFLAAVAGTTAFTRDDSGTAGVDESGIQLASRADRLTIADPPDPDPRAPQPLLASPARVDPPAFEDVPLEIRVVGLSQPALQQPPPSPVPRLPTQPDEVDRSSSGQPAWQRYALAAPPRDGRPLIALVFDDVGVNRRQAQRAIELPGPLTMSLMSYAQDLPNLARLAREAGHELMLHIPMEPHDQEKEPGPNALLTSSDDAELRHRIEWAMDRFSGYVGVNNHMGSRFTEDRRGMSIVMQAVSKRGLLFLDSRTSGKSVGYETALGHGIPAATRQVFLDHALGPDAVRASLVELEESATRRGYAIAIAHPREVTLEVIKQWLETVEQRGYRLAPISAVVARNYDLG